MIKRLNLSGHRRRRPEWLSGNEPSDGSLFSRRRPLQKLTVLIDAELLTKQRHNPPAGRPDPMQILSGLLEHPLVRLLRYSDEGPPPTAIPHEHARGAPVFQGWAVPKEHHPQSHEWSVYYPTDAGFTVSGVSGNFIDVASNDTQTDVYRELDPLIARTRRRADALAAQVAGQALQADLYVTERPYLHRATWSIADGVTLCHPREALALLSLYFRTQGEFLVAPRYAFNRGLFFWVGTRELLPEAWRWFTACVQHANASGNDKLMLLGGSLLQRVDRALEARDAIHIALNQAQNNDLQDDALANLDVLLVLLMGAVDVSARVAHQTLGLPPSKEYRAAWQDTKPKGWLCQVRAKSPDLAAVLNVGTQDQHALTILRLLRNSVHGAALQGVAVLRGSRRIESLVGLPVDDEATLLSAMDVLGGQANWGVRPSARGRSFVDPGILADRLFVATVGLLNNLMAKTPVEILPHVRISPTDAQPPTEPDADIRMDPFSPWVRESIRLQLGF